jgi:hypothetical protein
MCLFLKAAVRSYYGTLLHFYGAGKRYGSGMDNLYHRAAEAGLNTGVTHDVNYDLETHNLLNELHLFSPLRIHLLHKGL